jgi:hypothetical protein
MKYIWWLWSNWDTIGAGLLSVIGGFSILAKLTPTPKDDEILAKIVKALDFLALNKQRGGNEPAQTITSPEPTAEQRATLDNP